MKHKVKGHPGDDIVSYVSAIANMEGGNLVLCIEDKTLNVIGIQDTNGYNTDSIKLRLLRECTNLPSEGLNVQEFVTDDTLKMVWVIIVPKHQVKLPVYVHGVAWQRVGDSLVEMRPERREAILSEVVELEDWSAEVVPNSSITDLDELALAKARINFKKVHERIPAQEVDGWSVEDFLSHSGAMAEGVG